MGLGISIVCWNFVLVGGFFFGFQHRVNSNFWTLTCLLIVHAKTSCQNVSKCQISILLDFDLWSQFPAVFGVCTEALEVYGLEVLHSELSVDVWEPDIFTVKSWGVFFWDSSCAQWLYTFNNHLNWWLKSIFSRKKHDVPIFERAVFLPNSTLIFCGFHGPRQRCHGDTSFRSPQNSRWRPFNLNCACGHSDSVVKPAGTFLRVKVRGLFITVVGGGGSGPKVVAVFFVGWFF